MPNLSADSIRLLPSHLRHEFLASLDDDALDFIDGHWPFWARADQLPPPAAQGGGRWTTWLFLGGRGAGKTRAGAEWVRMEVEAGRARRLALVSETLADARDVMVEGASGLLALAWDERPSYVASRRAVIFPGGAVAHLFSAEDPDSLRGPQFDAAWADELAKWPYVEETWDMLQMGLRLGAWPRQVVTTTPRPIALLKALLADPATAVTRARTADNRLNLPESFLAGVLKRYAGTRLGRQELDAEIVEDNPNALWQRAQLERLRVTAAPALKRVVVAVDPPSSSGAGADECGIVAAGLGEDDKVYVLADRSVQGAAPLGWARAVVAAYQEFEADRIVAEVNQGGDLVATILRQIDDAVAVRAVHATRGKTVRAEPVAALYEQARVHHVGAFPKLEDQMCDYVPFATRGKSPDRLDALVWACTDLVLSNPRAEPRVRRL